MSRVVVYPVEREFAGFFGRAAEYWLRDHEIQFVTIKYHVYRYLKRKGFDVVLLQNFIDAGVVIEDFEDVRQDACMMEIKAGLFSQRQAFQQFEWLCKGFKSLLAIKKPELFITWNGSRMAEYTGAIVARQLGIPTLFFEIGNFPNKIFIDPEGVNAASGLVDADLAESADFDSMRLKQFLDKHKRKKEEAHLVPQVRNSKKVNYPAIMDYLYNAFSSYKLSTDSFGPVNKFLRKKRGAVDRISYDEYDYQNRSYILFPLQVSTDSQVLRNCDMTIQQCIEVALSQAQKYKCDLLIKPHPAERNSEIADYIGNLKSVHRQIYIVPYNTYMLIKHTCKVITINSTVGIEALIYHKHVEVLGKSFYGRYCQPDINKPVDTSRNDRFLYNYLFNILVTGDYFGNGPVQIDISRYIS